MVTILNKLSRSFVAGALSNSSHGPRLPLTTAQSQHQLGIQNISRTFSTSQVLYYKTKKRRKRYPFFWLQDQYRAYYDEQLTPKNEEFFQQFLKDKYPLNNGSPLKTEPWDTSETYTEGSQRVGLIAKKLGCFPMWTHDGTRLLCTSLMVSDNHVIKYHSPEEFARTGRPVDRKRYEGLGCMIVGADSEDPRRFTAEYNGLFKESGVMPKKKLTRFFVTHNARIEPGTPLVASHFRPGMFVDVYGKTIDHGWVSLRLRYKLKLGRKTHGNTKNHNRIGSIGRGRKECGPKKGKKMPGPYGHERRIMPGLKIYRIDTKYNLIYVRGPAIPGKNGAYVNIMDSRMPKKTLALVSQKIPVPFPTASLEEHSKLEPEMYSEEVHKASDPTIIMEITEAEKKAALLAARQGKAKTAQKIR